MKLQHIGQYIINPNAIAYIAEAGEGHSQIFFNAYAAASHPQAGLGYEMPSLCVNVSPLEIMAVINNEPSF